MNHLPRIFLKKEFTAFLFFFCISGITKAQIFPGLSRPDVKSKLQSSGYRNDMNRVWAETDSTIVFNWQENDSSKVTMFLGFDKITANCVLQKIISLCATCLEKELMNVLSISDMGWRKINESQYISSFEKQVLLELPDKEHRTYFSLLKTQWTPALYNLLTENQPAKK